MDGTMTVSNIDFNDMRIRTGIPAGDLFTVMESWEDDAKVNDAYSVILELESEACKTIETQPGLLEVLTLLRDNGARIGLVTRNTTISVDAFFAKIGEEWRDVFSVVLTREFRFVKPDKRLLLHVAQLWGLHPSKLLMVGDSREDVECGNAAGTATCLIQGGGNEISSGHTPSGTEPTYGVSTLWQLASILQGSAVESEELSSAVTGQSFVDSLFTQNIIRGSFCSYPRLAGAFGGSACRAYPGDTVAHLLCGDGGLTKLLASQGLKVQGFETDAQMAAIAIRRGLAVKILPSSIPSLNVGSLGAPSSFHVVISCSSSLQIDGSLIMLPWSGAADVDEIWRVLKLGGHFALEHLMVVDGSSSVSVEALSSCIRAIRVYRESFVKRGFISVTCSTEERKEGIAVRFIANKPGLQNYSSTN